MGRLVRRDPLPPLLGQPWGPAEPAAGIAAPASGDPDNNPFAYNIDFQIEADFAGLVAPAQPGAAIDIAWRAGHVMNYGDGVYGGVMVAAMTAEAFRARSLGQIVEVGRRAVPEGSSYREMIEDVIRWHRANPRLLAQDVAAAGAQAGTRTTPRSNGTTGTWTTSSTSTQG